jgi:predicted metalloenzyme YecM
MDSIHNEYGLYLHKLFVDHICIRIDSIELYQETKKEIEERWWVLLKENIIWWRKIAVYDIPSIKLSDNWDTLLELPAPKSSRAYTNWLQHIEVVTWESLGTILEKYPDLPRDMSWYNKEYNRDISLWLPGSELEVKLHEQPLRQVIQFQ